MYTRNDKPRVTCHEEILDARVTDAVIKASLRWRIMSIGSDWFCVLTADAMGANDEVGDGTAESIALEVAVINEGTEEDDPDGPSTFEVLGS
jgi:hypothetical protein